MSAADPLPLPAERARQKLRLSRLLPGPVILAIAAVVYGIAWSRYAEDLTYQIMWAYYVWPATIFLLFLWWMLLTGLPWKTRLKGLTVFVAAGITFFLVFRFDRFEGAMQPTFSKRFQYPTWPVAVFLMLYVGTVFSGWRWRTRALNTLGLLAAVGLSIAVGFTGFDLHRDIRDFASTGPRSAEAQQTARRITQDKARIDALAGRSELPLSTVTPAELLRAQKIASWESWRNVDAFALAVGSAPRAMFRSDAQKTAAINWPNFRGPQRDGIVREMSGPALRLDWTDAEPPNNLWNPDQRVGKGWSSFAVVGGFAITQEQRPEGESVVCYDFANGSQIWIHTDDERFSEPLGGVGPRATPTIAGRRVYTVGAKGTLNCLDFLTGEKLWQRNILTDASAKNLQWGMSGSPLVTGNLVIVNPGIHPDQKSRKAVIAYNRLTGDIVWAAGSHPASYSSPSLARIGGVDHLLIYHGVGLTAYDPNTGKELWNFGPWTNQPAVNVAIPIVRDIAGEHFVFISSGYQSGCAVLKVTVTNGKWDVVAASKQPNRFKLKFNDGVYHDGYVYGLDETILSCVSFKTGKMKWRQRGRYGYGQLLLVGDTLVIVAENGRVSFVKASPQRPTGKPPGFQALNRHVGTFDRKGIGWNQPVLVGGRLLIRNDREAACYDLTQPK